MRRLLAKARLHSMPTASASLFNVCYKHRMPMASYMMVNRFFVSILCNACYAYYLCLRNDVGSKRNNKSYDGVSIKLL